MTPEMRALLIRHGFNATTIRRLEDTERNEARTKALLNATIQASGITSAKLDDLASQLAAASGRSRYEAIWYFVRAAELSVEVNNLLVEQHYFGERK